jgi:hypothetical protein
MKSGSFLEDKPQMFGGLIEMPQFGTERFHLSSRQIPSKNQLVRIMILIKSIQRRILLPRV